MNNKRISLVITDLDNTLFDWFSQWYYAFDALLTGLAEESGISKETLIPEIKKIHQTHGTAEYAFLIEEIPSIRAKFPDGDLVKRFDEAIHAHRSARKAHLRLYPGVMATLQSLKEKGCLVVGYTESMGFYSNYRVRQLGLDGVLDYLYSPPDHDLPPGMTIEQIRKYPASYYELKRTKHNHTPKGELKPNPKLLLDIIDEVGGLPGETLYVGDNLWKDVQMAQEAGVTDVHASYGTAHTKSGYDELLVKVTHWTDEDVTRERDLKAHDVKAHTTLEKHFDEILGKFDFVPFNSGSIHSREDWTTNQVQIWKKTVDVQQHFNDIEMKIRSLAMTFVVALVGAVGFSIKEKLTIGAGEKTIFLPTVLLFAGFLIWLFFWFMDRQWYHRLLYGSVKQGMLIENKLKQKGYEISLTDSIGQESPIFMLGRKMRTPNKIDFFYFSIGSLLLSSGFYFVNPYAGGLVLLVCLGVLVWLFFTFEKQTE